MADANVWPPVPFDIAFDRFRELDAWYTGDTQTLSDIYGGRGHSTTHTVAGRAYRGGVLGTLSKWFWGEQIDQQHNHEGRMRVHLPLAADLCTLSADLLFGEAPQVLFARPDDFDDGTKDNPDADPKVWRHPAQERLDAIIATDEARAELLLAGEYAAAHGGTYIATAWDVDLADHVFPKVFAADCAIPEFRFGRLASVKLWTEYFEGSDVYRLVEEHQPGSITYTLYCGTVHTLGQVVPLTDRPETSFYETMRNTSDVEAVGLGVDLPMSVSVGTGSQRLDVVYMPNARPVRDWRKLGVLANLGRSDLDGIQDLLDKADQTWSSLMRDVDNGQGRILASEDLLELNGPGKGAEFDMYRQVLTPVGPNLGKAADGGMPIQVVQFDIRVEEHLQVIEGLKKEIASALGYSPSHLGIENKTTSTGRTATQVVADLSDSERTRDKKALYAKAALAKWSLAALEIDKTIFNGDDLGDLSIPPDVIFAPVSQADPEKLARTAQLLTAAQAASRQELVRTVHPDWDPEQVSAEAKAIDKEIDSAPKMQDPTFPPFGNSASDPTADVNDGAAVSV